MVEYETRHPCRNKFLLVTLCSLSSHAYILVDTWNEPVFDDCEDDMMLGLGNCSQRWNQNIAYLRSIVANCCSGRWCVSERSCSTAAVSGHSLVSILPSTSLKVTTATMSKHSQEECRVEESDGGMETGRSTPDERLDPI